MGGARAGGDVVGHEGEPLMDWINLHTSTLDSVEFLGSEPVDRATWLCLMRYCCGQENGGVIREATSWGDRRWQQLCGVMLVEVKRECALWKWIGADLHVHAYPRDKEHEVRAKRQGGIDGAAKRWGNGSANGSPIENPHAEGKGREGKGMEGVAIQPPPIPFNGKIDTANLLASFGLPNGPKDTAEWRGGLSKVARCRSEAEARAFITWAMRTCTSHGVEVEHFRHVRALAGEWPTSVHNQFIKPTPQEDAQ